MNGDKGRKGSMTGSDLVPSVIWFEEVLAELIAPLEATGISLGLAISLTSWGHWLEA